jgi:DNA-binding NarL/FixJ family response regulator
LIRVQIIAASPVVRAGLKALIEDGGTVEVVESGAAADVVVIDAESDPGAALEPEGPAVVMLTDDGDSVRQSEGWPTPVRALLARNAGAVELAAAIQAVAAGFVVLRPEEADWTTVRPRATAGSVAARPGESLTPREVQVMQMIAEGESNKRIAFRLGISEHTVKFHVASVLSKLNAGSRAEALAIGIRRGLVYL